VQNLSNGGFAPAPKDDTPDIMTKTMPTIHPAEGPAAMWLTITPGDHK